ncbi:hypothetical protein [Tenacibaculum aiptasiae]|uniref:hypothetical protein n=1 Tax=Tenacibaculum aiptasiae TaxID=426481 RepID=UPI00232D6788|nr:hypothetical protein [Tenacibaculum aiptasiae]
MTKQQKTYLLLAAVILIWGIIGYQFFNQFSSNTPEVTTASSFEFVPKKITKQEAYTVKADYRDPFLGKLPSDKKKKVIVRKKAPKTNIPFPNITYNGVIEGGSKSFILTINGMQEEMSIGQTLHKVTLKKANSSKAVVVFNSVSKTIQLLE